MPPRGIEGPPDRCIYNFCRVPHDPAGHSRDGSGAKQIKFGRLLNCEWRRRIDAPFALPRQGDTMGTLYQHCYLDCPSHHAIPIPHSSLVEKIGNPVQNTTELAPVVVACPECGLVSAYLPDKMFGYLAAGEPSLFQAGECHLVAMQAHCDGENCKAPKIVHAIWGNENGNLETQGNAEGLAISGFCPLPERSPITPRPIRTTPQVASRKTSFLGSFTAVSGVEWVQPTDR